MYEVIVFVHVIALVYWVGADVGVFYASRYVVDPDVPPAGRAVAAKVVHAIDLLPRIFLILTLPTGAAMMALHPGGDRTAGWPLAAVVAVSAVWLALMLAAFFGPAGRRTEIVRGADSVLRVVLALGLLAFAVLAALADPPFGIESQPGWLVGKFVAYALCILGGLAIRVVMRPFGPALGAVVSGKATAEDNRVVATSLRGTYPWVYLVWGAALVAAFLGIVKPGA